MKHALVRRNIKLKKKTFVGFCCLAQKFVVQQNTRKPFFSLNQITGNKSPLLKNDFH